MPNSFDLVELGLLVVGLAGIIGGFFWIFLVKHEESESQPNNLPKESLRRFTLPRRIVKENPELKESPQVSTAENQIYQTTPQQYNRCPQPPGCGKLFLDFDVEVDYTTTPPTKWNSCPICHTRIVLSSMTKAEQQKVAQTLPGPAPVTNIPVPAKNWQKNEKDFTCLECGNNFTVPKMVKMGTGVGAVTAYYCPELNCNKLLISWEKQKGPSGGY